VSAYSFSCIDGVCLKSHRFCTFRGIMTLATEMYIGVTRQSLSKFNNDALLSISKSQHFCINSGDRNAIVLMPRLSKDNLVSPLALTLLGNDRNDRLVPKAVSRVRVERGPDERARRKRVVRW